MGDRQSLRESLLECVDDMDSVIKQIMAFLFEKDRSFGSLTCLCELFRAKYYELRELLNKVPQHMAREEIIRKLEKAVEVRNLAIEQIENKFILSEKTLTEAVHQAGIKLKSIRQAESRRLDSEQIIRFANQISKSYSVTAPPHWQMGDPSRPFPTEMEIRMSLLATSRVAAPTGTTALSLLRQPASAASGLLRGSTRGASSSPAASYSGMQRSWSPRAGFVQQSASPRGRGRGTGGLTSPRLGGSLNMLQRRQSGASPRLSSPSSTFNISGKTMGNLAPIEPAIEQMSSDSSSSSSSDDGSPS